MGKIAGSAGPQRKNKQTKLHCDVGAWGQGLDDEDIDQIESWFADDYTASAVYEHLVELVGDLPFNVGYFQKHRGRGCVCKVETPLMKPVP